MSVEGSTSTMSKRKKVVAVLLDISQNHQEVTEGYKQETFKGLSKYADESVDDVVMNGVLEQTPGKQRPAVMREIQRVLKPGAKAQASVALWNTTAAIMSPFSEWPPMGPESFGFFSAKVRKESKYENPLLSDIDFEIGWAEVYNPDWEGRSEVAKNFAVRHYTNVLQGLKVVMTKKGKANG